MRRPTRWRMFLAGTKSGWESTFAHRDPVSESVTSIG